MSENQSKLIASDVVKEEKAFFGQEIRCDKVQEEPMRFWPDFYDLTIIINGIKTNLLRK